MKRLTTFAVALASLFCLTGCIEQGSLITVNPDGSGEILYRSASNPEGGGGMAAMFGGAGGAPPTEAPDPVATSKAQVMKDAEALGDVVTFKEGKEIKTKQGWPGYQAVYTFKDINKLVVPVSSISMPGEEKAAVDEAIRFKFAAGRLEVIPPPLNDGGEGLAKANDPQAAMMMQMMAPMLKGMRMASIVKVNGTVTSSTADLSMGASKNAFVLYDIQLDKVIADPALMKQMAGWAQNPPAKSIDVPGVKFQKPNASVVIEFN